jgi:hypothetical protein
MPVRCNGKKNYRIFSQSTMSREKLSYIFSRSTMSGENLLYIYLHCATVLASNSLRAHLVMHESGPSSHRHRPLLGRQVLDRQSSQRCHSLLITPPSHYLVFRGWNPRQDGCSAQGHSHSPFRWANHEDSQTPTPTWYLFTGHPTIYVILQVFFKTL